MSENARKYSNDQITVFWKPSKCIHATICFRELIQVFNPRKKPWINMQGAPTERIIEVVNKCPTGALSYSYNQDLDQVPDPVVQNTATEITPEDVLISRIGEETITQITVMKNGPLLVEGKFRIIDARGNELPIRELTSFCRCGNSQSKPFCDGNHRKTGFRD